MPKEEARTKKIKLLAFLDSRKANKEGNRENSEAAEGNHTPGQYCTCTMSLLEQLQDANNYVVNITKPRSLQDREYQIALELDQHRAWASKRQRNMQICLITSNFLA